MTENIKLSKSYDMSKSGISFSSQRDNSDARNDAHTHARFPQANVNSEQALFPTCLTCPCALAQKLTLQAYEADTPWVQTAKPKCM